MIQIITINNQMNENTHDQITKEEIKIKHTIFANINNLYIHFLRLFI